MNKTKLLVRSLSAAAALLGLLVCGPASTGWSGEAKPKAPKKEAAPGKKKLTGAELYAIHCNRCHPQRYPTERTAGEWKTLMAHMRVRANLPAREAKAILSYMQEESGK